jgi:hypothetical protein
MLKNPSVQDLMFGEQEERQSWIKNAKREELLETMENVLFEEWENNKARDAVDLLMNGCQGYNNMRNEEIRQELREIFEIPDEEKIP